MIQNLVARFTCKSLLALAIVHPSLPLLWFFLINYTVLLITLLSYSLSISQLEFCSCRRNEQKGAVVPPLPPLIPAPPQLSLTPLPILSLLPMPGYLEVCGQLVRGLQNFKEIYNTNKSNKPLWLIIRLSLIKLTFYELVTAQLSQKYLECNSNFTMHIW